MPQSFFCGNIAFRKICRGATMQRKVKHQVFISSTYKDLQEERWAVLRSLLSMDCIVSGMELFPAIDMEQFDYIKQIIDDCDYYVLILGGRYGSESPEGLSYTEMEYDYACSKGIPVIALVFDKPDELPTDKRETDPDPLRKFRAFRAKAASARLVRFWSDIKELQLHVIQAFHHAEKNFPALGWVRANTVASEEILADLNTIRKENEQLKEEMSSLKKACSPVVENLASLTDELAFRFTPPMEDFGQPHQHFVGIFQLTWKELFLDMFNLFREGTNKSGIDYFIVRTYLSKDTTPNEWTFVREKIVEKDLNIIINQFLAHNLIQRLSVQTEDNGIEVMYVLTESGTRYGLTQLAIKNDIIS